KSREIPISKIDTEYRSYKSHKTYGTYFALDSCASLDVVFYSKDSSKQDTAFTNHPNHVIRFDWLLLSASPDIEVWLRKIFDISGSLKLHEGCCDFWRTGPPDDFCFFRFEISPLKAKGKNNWLSIEPG